MHIWRDLSGTSAIELALITPLFVVFFLGMTAFGLYVSVCQSVQDMAAAAARAAVAGLNEKERRILANEFIEINAAAYPFIDLRKLTVEMHDSRRDAFTFVVAIRYDTSALPVWGLLHGLPLPGRVISRQSMIRIGGM